MKVYAPKRYKGGAEKWFTEIFRVHTLDEYAEFFARGWKKQEGTHRVYPWFYSRVFLLCLVLFAALAFTTTATAEVLTYIGLPTVILLGAILINIPLMVLLYELYPKLDFSFFALCVITFIGSAISDVLINFGYYFFTPENKWLSTLWTAFIEETGKALPMLVALFVLKKREPLQCLIIGASAGIGMAICEDMGYIFFSAIAGFADMGQAVFVTILRALTSFFGHTIWTGFICWAFAKFKRPLINIKFWGMYILSMALHYIWDFPELSTSLLTILVSLLIGIIVFVRIIKRERFNIFYPQTAPQPLAAVTEIPPAPSPEEVAERAIAYGAVTAEIISPDSAALTEAADTSASDDPFAEFAPSAQNAHVHSAPALNVPVFNRAGIALAVTSILLSVLAMAFCMFGVNGGVDTYYFDTAEDFIFAVQDGLNLNTDTDREYDVRAENYSEYIIEGKAVQVVQKATYGEFDYYYTYSAVFYGYAFESVEVEVDGERYALEVLYDGTDNIYYYNLIPDMQSCYYSPDYEAYVAVTFTEYSFNKSVDIVLGIIAGGVLVLGGAIALAFGMEQRKKKTGK